MDRFLDEQDNPAPVRERSASPSISSLIYGDPKRQHIELEAALEMVQKVVGSNNPVFSPLKLHPDLQPPATDASTEPHPTVSISPEPRGGQQSTENTVHIANFTNNLQHEDLSNGLVEPSPKRLKVEEDRTEQKQEQTVAPAVVTTTVSDSITTSSTTSTTSSATLKDLPPHVKTVSYSTENGNHVNNVEVSISSVNSVHSLVDGSLHTPSLSGEPLPARPTEPVAQ